LSPLSRTGRRLVSLAVGVVLAAGLFAALTLVGGSSGDPAAAPFSLTALGGGAPVEVPVVEHGTTMPVVIVFFASWCVPCRSELPAVARTAASLTEAGTRVAFVGIDGNDTTSDGLAFAHQSGVRFPVGEDPDSAVASRYGLPGYPATVFVDAAGDVVHVVQGPVSSSRLRHWALRIALPR
jgi:thiol-disulfide isomerase/thioredoxin